MNSKSATLSAQHGHWRALFDVMKQPSTNSDQRSFMGLILGGILLAVGLCVGANSLFERSLPLKSIPVLTKVQADLVATERSGRSVKFSDLKGKVVVCAYLYTVCPHGCAAITAQMQLLLKRFGERADFHLLSVAIHPDRDTPALLTNYAEAVGAKPDSPWWFVTGEQKSLWNFMTHELHLEPAKAIPEDERVNPLDHYEHDLRMVLIDRQGQVRRYYSVFHPQPEIAALMCENLPQDVQRLLDHPEL